MDDLDQFENTLKQIEEVLRKHSDPGVNSIALSSIQRLCGNLRNGDSYIYEKAGQLSHLASIFYSARKHLKYQGGAERLYAEISYDLPGRISGQIDHLRRLRAQRSNMNKD